MQPWAVGAEQELARASALQRFGEEIEAAHARAVGVHVGVTDQDVDEGALRPPVVGKAAEMRDDEGDVRIFLGHEVDDRDLAHQVVEHGQPPRPRDLADLPADAGVVAVHLDAAEAMALDGLADQRSDPAGVAGGVDEREAPEPVRPARTIRATSRLAIA